MISFFVPEIFKFSCYANLVTDDVTGCASTVVQHKIKNISANNEAMQLKLGRDVAPCKIYHLLHILMLLWQEKLNEGLPRNISGTLVRVGLEPVTLGFLVQYPNHSATLPLPSCCVHFNHNNTHLTCRFLLLNH